MTDSPSILTQLVANAERLFTLPTIAAEVLELSRSQRVDAHALKKCIERDPALAARLLKTANSSLFGARRPITDLTQALSLLGTKALKLLVLSFSLPEDLFAGHEAEALALYWRHTLIKAVAARELAERIWRQPGDEAFVAGLLQDIGQLVLLQQLGEPYRRFVKHVAERGGDLIALETQSLGFDHTILSARLLRHWGLPEALFEAIGALASAPGDASAQRPLVEILHFAELLARLFSQQQPYALREVLDLGERSGRLDYRQLQELVATLDEKVAELGDTFALYPQGGPTLAELLAQANAQLSDLAFDLYFDVSRLGEELKEAAQQPANLIPARTASAVVENVTAKQETVRYDGFNSKRRQPTVAEQGNHRENDPALLGRVSAAIARGRQTRRPISLVMLEIDRFSDWLLLLGPERGATAGRLLQAAATQLSPHGGTCLEVGESQYALLWENCDRSEAGQSARMLARLLTQWWEQRGESAELTFSIGIATLTLPSKNFPARELMIAAQRCLSAAGLSGGNCVKSIDV